MKQNKSCFLRIVSALLLALLLVSCKTTGNLEQTEQKQEDIQFFTLDNGIPVFYLENVYNKIDAVSISLKGGVYNLTEEESGLEYMTFNMMTAGSEKYSYDDLLSYSYYTNSSLGYSCDTMGSMLYIQTISDYLDDSLDILIDAYLHPVFAETEYDKIMTNVYNGLEQQANDPNSLAGNNMQKAVTKGHPYAVSASPTEDSVENLTLDAIKAYYPNVLDSRRLAVFAVTRKDAAELVAKLNETVGTIPTGTGTIVTDYSVPEYTIGGEPIVETRPASAGTAFMYRAYSLPPYGAPDFFDCAVANSLYSTTMFNILRNKYGACYTPQAAMSGNLVSFGFEMIYRCSDFENILVYLDECRELMAAGQYISSTNEDGSYVLVPFDDVLEGTKNALINSTYSSQMTTVGLLSRMISGYTMFNDVCALEDQADAIRAVTADGVIAAFNKYYLTDRDQWSVVCGEDVKAAVLTGLSR